MINHARRTRYLTQVRLPARRPRSFVEQNDDDDDDGGAALRPVERPRDLENSRQGEVPGRNFVYSHVMSIAKGDVEDVGLHLVLSSRLSAQATIPRAYVMWSRVLPTRAVPRFQH